MNITKLLRILAFCFFSLFVTSCALQPQAETMRPSVFSMPARIRISLTHTPTGTAELRWSPMSHTLTVIIAIVGLAPNSTHLVHIHVGNCTMMGPIVYEFRPLVADAHGVGSSTTTINKVLSRIPSSGWGINIHNGSTFATDLNARPIACGNVSGVQTMTSGVQLAHAQLSATISPDENVHGMAQVMVMNKTIIITLSLTGMAPNTTHMAHLHAGRCAAQGPVLFALQPVVADAQGSAKVVTTIKGQTLPPTHWYINVHEAGTSAAMMTPQGFNPISCGDGMSPF